MCVIIGAHSSVVVVIVSDSLYAVDVVPDGESERLSVNIFLVCHSIDVCVCVCEGNSSGRKELGDESTEEMYATKH